MRSFLRPAGLLVAIASFALAACGGAPEEDASNDQGAIQQSEGLKLCAAVRGNGESILTHFASLARIVEHYGIIDGIAGGSSGSITTFGYESILKSPVVHVCKGEPCAADADAARVALALKSLQGYANAVGDSEEGDSVNGLVGAIGKIKEAYTKEGIASVDPANAAEAAKRLKEVLSIPGIAGIVNKEMVAMLNDVPNLAFNVAEVKEAIEQIGAYKVDDNRLFFRTGVLDWPVIAKFFGHVGDFYAGYGPTDDKGMNAWLDACAEPTRDKPWADAAKVVGADGKTCGDTFSGLVAKFRKALDTAPAYHSRVDDFIGDPKSPLHKLVTSAVLEGQAAKDFKAVHAQYAAGKFPSGLVPFTPSFADVHFGYWGSDADVAAAKAGTRHTDDLKTKKFSSLGNAKWSEILAASPAEPGLSRFVELSDGRFSAGGWSDLHPSLVLQNMGCEKVVYVTREGDESQFAAKIAKFVGLDEAAWTSLYDLSNPKSSYSISVASADAVWCTKWDSFTDSQMSAEVLDAWNSPLETRPSFASVVALRPYSGATSKTDRVGCTPGKSGGAKFPK